MQRATYGRLLQGRRDALTGYALRSLAISDLEVVRLSGTAVHGVAVHTGDPKDRIEGTVFTLTAAELETTDVYEVDYVRTSVLLASGARAHLYIGKPNAP